MLLTGIGCSSTKAPTVEITDVALGEVTDEGFVLNFGLDLNNANDKPLSLTDIKYQLSIDGKRVYSGVRSAEATIAAGSAKHLVAPAVVLYEELGTSNVPDLINYRLNGKLWYLKPGALAETMADVGLQRPSVSFKKRGELQLGE